MRTIDAHTEERLSREAASLCACWRITRRDGVEIGLTDHDAPLRFGGTSFEPGAGGTALRATADLAPDDAEIEGALSSDLITEEDLAAGRYDGAAVELWCVDWQDPAARLLLRTGTLGEASRRDGAWTAEFLSLKHALGTVAGRVYGRSCDARVGDARCRVDLTDPRFGTDASVASPGELTLTLDAGEGFERGWFAGGALRVLDGPLAGLSVPVRDHDGHAVTLWRALPQPLAEGTRVRLTAGCDHRFETCRAKFRNGLNFRGHPHVPGNDVLTAYPVPGENA
jgi:uncharacterized phage protein (TIGR02218 family)